MLILMQRMAETKGKLFPLPLKRRLLQNLWNCSDTLDNYDIDFNFFNLGTAFWCVSFN